MKLTLDTDNQVFFYEQDYYVLSNFSSFRVVVFDFDFQTAEHAYHWRKFTVNDPLIAAQIFYARSAHDAFKIAEKHKAEQAKNWNAVRLDVMREILRAKAGQHEYVGRKLLSTGNRELIENSWRDSFWGWGEDRNGKNMLGKLWMEVRSELKHLESIK